MRGFEILYEALGIMSTMSIFFYIYGKKVINKGSLVLVSVLTGTGLITHYCSNYKNWKDKFVQVRGDTDYPNIIFEEDEKH